MTANVAQGAPRISPLFEEPRRCEVCNRRYQQGDIRSAVKEGIQLVEPNDCIRLTFSHRDLRLERGDADRDGLNGRSATHATERRNCGLEIASCELPVRKRAGRGLGIARLTGR